MPQSEPQCDITEPQRDITDMSDRIEAVSESLSTRTGPSKSKTGRSEKVERTSGAVELSHGSIPDVAAMLPLSSDGELRDVDFNEDDDIAETLQQSHMTDSQDGGGAQSFMLVDHNEELQV